jgi:hypothetical protein
MAQSKYHRTEKLDKELHDAFEERTWRERCNTTEDGHVFIPPTAFKNCIAETAKFLSVSIPGKGKSTYTKHFEAGIMVIDGLKLPVKKEKVKGLWLHVPSDGRRGGTKRVMKCFPTVAEWGGDVTFYILDDTITKDVFDYHLAEAGKFIGIGSFRPRNNGFFGRFEVVKTAEAK